MCMCERVVNEVVFAYACVCICIYICIYAYSLDVFCSSASNDESVSCRRKNIFMISYRSCTVNILFYKVDTLEC